MKNREEFEEYVRGLAEKKLALKQKRRAKIRRAALSLGSCAAGICVALAAYMNFTSGSSEKRDILAELDKNHSIQEEIEVKENATIQEHTNGTVCTKPQDKDCNETVSSEVCLPEGSTDSWTSDKADESGPDSVNISLNGRSFKLEEKQKIISIVNGLNALEITGRTDSSDETVYITLELVYSDRTVICIFTENSLEVSGKGTFAVPPDAVSEFAELVDSFTVSVK